MEKDFYDKKRLKLKNGSISNCIELLDWSKLVSAFNNFLVYVTIHVYRLRDA